MADNVDIRTNAGQGAVVGTDERVIASEVVQVQRVDEQGAQFISSGQVALTGLVANIVNARPTRKRLVMANHGNDNIFIGSSGVTETTGMKIPPGAGLTLYIIGPVYGITDNTPGIVHYIEEYD